MKYFIFICLITEYISQPSMRTGSLYPNWRHGMKCPWTISRYHS